MKGNITRRGLKSWRIKFDLGRDATGKRQIAYHTVKGTRADAEQKLHDLLHAAGKGAYIAPTKVTVADFLRDRLKAWVSSAEPISPLTAERYGELIEHQILPHLGTKPIQALKGLDIERWHATLRASGRKDGNGGLGARTIAHAHRR